MNASVRGKDLFGTDYLVFKGWRDPVSGYENARYYIVDYETPDIITEEYYKEVSVNCRIIIEEKFALVKK